VQIEARAPDTLEAPERVYYPELLSRRGEYLSWGTAILGLVGWLILRLSGRPIISAVSFLVVFFILTASTISLGNWMDRKTFLRISHQEIEFSNGLRHVRLTWDKLQRVQVIGTAWGKKVRVFSEPEHFDFRTLGEFKVGGDVKGRMGFIQGDLILSQILERSNMKEVSRSENSYYYARR
jgi:hypothetical protein